MEVTMANHDTGLPTGFTMARELTAGPPICATLRYMLNGDTPADHWSLATAQDWLRKLVNDGVRCPCCTQWAQVYYRTINSGMAIGAIRLYRWQQDHPGEFAHLPTIVGRRSSEEAKLSYWHLLEEEPATRPDGGRTGRWRLTNSGIEWVKGTTTMPWYAKVYNDRVLWYSLESRSGQVKGRKSIRDALGDGFDYNDLMGGE